MAIKAGVAGVQSCSSSSPTAQLSLEAGVYGSWHSSEGKTMDTIEVASLRVKKEAMLRTIAAPSSLKSRAGDRGDRMSFSGAAEEDMVEESGRPEGVVRLGDGCGG